MPSRGQVFPALPAARELRQAVVRRHQRHGARRRSRASRWPVITGSCWTIPSSSSGCPRSKVGLLPGAGGTQRLPRLIGIREALAADAGRPPPGSGPGGAKLGICPRAASDIDEMMEKARRWLLGRPVIRSSPGTRKASRSPAVPAACIRRAVQDLYGRQRDGGGEDTTQLSVADRHHVLRLRGHPAADRQGPEDRAAVLSPSLLSGPVARNMIRTLFCRQGEADKLVRRPAGIDKSKVEKLGILGAGMMGAASPMSRPPLASRWCCWIPIRTAPRRASRIPATAGETVARARMSEARRGGDPRPHPDRPPITLIWRAVIWSSRRCSRIARSRLK